MDISIDRGQPLHTKTYSPLNKNINPLFRKDSIGYFLNILAIIVVVVVVVVVSVVTLVHLFFFFWYDEFKYDDDVPRNLKKRVFFYKMKKIFFFLKKLKFFIIKILF